MLRAGLDDLMVFELVARLKSFTRAAAILGVPQSSVSRSMRTLEERVGVRLLARTTRSVAATEAGERLLLGLRPALESIQAELMGLNNFRDKPSGNLRLTAVRHAFDTVLRPVLPSFFIKHPDVSIEVAIDDGFADIIESRFDAGIRFGGFLEKDMLAVRVGADVQSAIVATPGYLATHSALETPDDLVSHQCINYRLASSGGLYPWHFKRDGQALDVRVEGNLTLNDGDAILAAALDGLGLAYVFLDKVKDDIARGRLVSVLADWCGSFPGYHIYHSSRRQTPPALTVLIEALQLQRKNSKAN